MSTIGGEDLVSTLRLRSFPNAHAIDIDDRKIRHHRTAPMMWTSPAAFHGGPWRWRRLTRARVLLTVGVDC